jgi:hypothetical protein
VYALLFMAILAIADAVIIIGCNKLNIPPEATTGAVIIITLALGKIIPTLVARICEAMGLRDID